MKRKSDLPIINAEQYQQEPDRYELRKGDAPGAPPCPYGNQFQWIGFDKQGSRYVRLTKSVFKRLINLQNPEL